MGIEEATLLKDFAIIMAVAGAVTLLFRWLHQPPILGYLIAGLLVGPYTFPNLSITDDTTIRLLADLGLVVLLFGIGLEFSWSKIRQVGLAVIMIGAMEIMTMISLGYGLGRAMGWTPLESLFLGCALHISSSAIIVKLLRDEGKLGNLPSKLIVGILVVEDFAAVVIISLLSGIGSTDTQDAGQVGWLIGRLIAFIAASLVVGALLVPKIMSFTHRFHSKEACLVTSLGLCFIMALLGDWLELSAAIGAFLVGAIIADTDQSEEVVEVVTPIRDMFAALFFVTIGMLINISQFDDFILPAIIVAVMFILGKIIANAVAAFTAGYSGRTAVHVGMGMPQMGEFSLAIAKTGADSGVVTTPLYPIIASATAITSFTTPYISRSAERVANFIDRRSPKLLRAYLASLADWLGTLRAIFSRDSSSARKVQHSFKVIVVNLLIVIVLISTGTFTLQYIDSLSRWSHFGREVVALMVGATILFLCFPCIVVIWRSLHDIVNEATIYMISKRKSAKPWRQEALRHVLTDSMLIVLTVFLFVSFIPFMAGLFDVGHRAIVIPLLLVALALYFVSTSVWHIHSRVESTFSRTLIGDELVSSDEASRILGVTVRTVEQMARERRLPGTKEGKQWRISKAALEAMAIGDSSSGDMSINEDEAQ